MNYFILSAKTKSGGIGYWCVNGITRFIDEEGTDWTVFLCSSVPQRIITADVICITPATPTSNQLAVFKTA